MSLPEVVSREQWLEARKELLRREKEVTRARKALNADRRRLPMVKIDKSYLFQGPQGEATLAELFDGRRQLVVQHVMFDPSWDDACRNCTAAVDELAPGMIAHLNAQETTYVLVSRAPLEKIEGYRDRRGWSLPWYSSHGSDFNYDFHVTLDASVAPVEFNYRDADELERIGMTWVLEGSSEVPGYSCFVRDGDTVYHTYSTFARGSEEVGGSYNVLGWTAFGRHAEPEAPKERTDYPHGIAPSFLE